MRKKLFKYIKFLISMVLILGIVAPSYASLSASDGSAFVTKAEFDSALADFNARLTTFEAGINSKIDSQVTSYLDRNGIWNGKAQIIPTGVVDWTGRSKSDLSAFHKITSNKMDNTSDSYYLGGFVLMKANKSGLVQLVMKDRVNSTLLCRMNVGCCVGGFDKSNFMSDLGLATVVDLTELLGTWDDSEVGQLFYKSTNSKKTYFQPDLSKTNKRSFDDNTGRVVASQNVWTFSCNTLDFTTNVGTTRYWVNSFVNGQQYTLLGFVEKGKYYSLSWRQTMWMWSGFSKDIYCRIGSMSDVDGQSIIEGEVDCRPQCEVLKCDIY